MNLSESLAYTFKASNIPKILTIVLIFVISGVSIFVATMALESFALMALLIPVGLVYSFFISGYTVSIIKSVMGGDENLPEFELGRNLGRGFMIFLAGIVYMIPVFIIFFLAMLISGASISSTSQYGDPGGSGVLLFCGIMLGAFLLTIVLMYSLVVGQIRYAVEDSAGSLFNIGKNFSIVMSNIGTTIAYFIRGVGLAIIFGIVSNILLGVLQVPFAGQMRELQYEYVRAVEGISYGYNYSFDPAIIFNMGMSLVAFASLYYLVSLTLNLMQGFSGAHLMAGYGIDLGLGGKDKNKNYSPYDDFNDPYDL